MEPTATLERQKYEQMWTFTEYRDDHATAHARAAIEQMGMAPGSSVIDFGSGAGYASRYFHRHRFRVLAVDIARNAMAPEIAPDIPILIANLWDVPVDISGEWGFCCDVMEHIPTERVRDVLRFVRRSTKAATYFSISLRPDCCGQLIGETLHLTVRGLDWWMTELGCVWEDMRIVCHRDGDSADFIVSGHRRTRGAAGAA